jgi:ribosomal protein S18 acetylase RimI-like enzyme
MQALPDLNRDYHVAAFTIVEATPAMRDALHDCHRDVRYGTDAGLKPAYAKATLDSGYYEEFWQTALNDPDHITLAAMQGEKIIGFIRLGPADAYDIPNGDAALGELHQIYIHRDFQGHGLGGALYAAGTAALQARGYDGMVINALSENARAIGFYEHQGASQVATVTEQKERQGQMFTLNCAILRHDF